MSRRKNPNSKRANPNILEFKFGEAKNLTIDAVAKSQTKVEIDLGLLIYDLGMFEDDFEKFKKDGGVRVVGNQIWVYPGKEVLPSWDRREREYLDPIKVDYYPYIIGIEDDVENSGGHILGVNLEGYYKQLFHWGTGSMYKTKWRDLVEVQSGFQHPSKAKRFADNVVYEAFRKNPADLESLMANQIQIQEKVKRTLDNKNSSVEDTIKQLEGLKTNIEALISELCENR